MNRRHELDAGDAVDIWQPGRTHPVVVVLCEGPGPVLLDDEPAPGSGAPLTLAPGDSVQWQADRALSLAADAVATSVLITENPGQPTPATAIARAILAQGLAVDIASAISLAGVPAIDRPQVVMPALTATVPAGGTWSSGALSVAQWATALVTLSIRGNAGLLVPKVTTAELRWCLDDGTAVTTDRLALWLAAGGGTQAWQVQAPCLGARLQVVVPVPAAGDGLTQAVITCGVVATYRERVSGCSVVTAAGRWGGTLDTVSRGRLSPSTSILRTPSLAAGGQTWRDVVSPAWPGQRLTLGVQGNALSLDTPLQVAAIDDTGDVRSLAVYDLTANDVRWTFTLDTPPDSALILSIPTGSGRASDYVIETSWSATPVGLPGLVTDL